MAREVFDDVAFFYLATSIIAIFVLPWTLWKLVAIGLDHYRAGRQAQAVQHVIPGKGGIPCECNECLLKKQKLQQQKQGWTRHITLGNILFVLLWSLFLFCIFQIPNVSNEQLTSFKPFEILQLDSSATEEQIKRAYRKLSLKYHPDKNVNDPDAAEKFMLISKAYNTLTDPAAKENIEKYGNPDGYQGTKIALGLPTFLTKKENEMHVLLVYFLIFIVIPPVCVFIWWNSAKNFLETGVFTRTMGAYHQLIGPNMGPRFLIEILALSTEYEQLQLKATAESEVAIKQLYNEVKDTMVKQRFYDPTGRKFGNKLDYVHRVSVLIHAYLQRIPIPTILQNDLNFILKDAHKLLNHMLEVALRKQMLRPTMGIIDLMQMLTQCMWVHWSPLMQLPYFDINMCKRIVRKNITSIQSLKRTNEEKRNKLLPEITNEQWKEINVVLDLFPDIEMSIKYEVEDEVGLYEGDVITLTVNLERVMFDPERPESKHREQMDDEDEEENNKSKTIKEEVEEVVPKKATKADRHNAFKNRGHAETVKEESKTEATVRTESVEMTEKENGVNGVSTDASQSVDSIKTENTSADDQSVSASSVSPRYLDEDKSIDELLDGIPEVKQKSSLFQENEGPLVHATHFPYEKREKWVVFLLEKSKKSTRIIGIQKVPALYNKQEVTILFNAPKYQSLKQNDSGIYEYEVHAMCDSYIGCDVMKEFTLKVGKARRRTVEEEMEIQKKREEEFKQIYPDENEEEYIGQWYYLGFASFWEMILNIIVMGLLCVFIFNFLVSRGYWQKYVTPMVEIARTVTTPLWNVMSPYVSPLLTPIVTYALSAYNWVGHVLTVETEEQKLQRLEEERLTNIPGMGVDDIVAGVGAGAETAAEEEREL